MYHVFDFVNQIENYNEKQQHVQAAYIYVLLTTAHYDIFQMCAVPWQKQAELVRVQQGEKCRKSNGGDIPDFPDFDILKC